MKEYLGLLDVNGSLVQVGIPEDGELTAPILPLIPRRKVESSLIGSPAEIREMLNLVAEKGVKPWIQTIPMKEANRAIVDMRAGNARYRYVLSNKAQ